MLMDEGTLDCDGMEPVEISDPSQSLSKPNDLITGKSIDR
jgi:hypothetical protein